ncbi:MAG: hypothetical protein ACRDYB_08965, partial [Acidimicrobiales bacterium]
HRVQDEATDRFAAGIRKGLLAKELCAILVAESGFTNVRADVKVPGTGLQLHLVASDESGTDWAFEVTGALTANRSGLKRAETLWRAIGRATVLHEVRPDLPLVIITTDRPGKGTAGRVALEAVTGADRPVFDVVGLLEPADRERLAELATGSSPTR